VDARRGKAAADRPDLATLKTPQWSEGEAIAACTNCGPCPNRQIPQARRPGVVNLKSKRTKAAACNALTLECSAPVESMTETTSTLQLLACNADWSSARPLLSRSGSGEAAVGQPSVEAGREMPASDRSVRPVSSPVAITTPPAPASRPGKRAMLDGWWPVWEI
jgi:hypothetical protein